jgi:PAS domain S-box-containing protein
MSTAASIIQMPQVPGEHPQDVARMLKTLLASVDGMVYRRRLDPDWTMEFVSSGCLRVTGHHPGDLLFNNQIAYGELVNAEDRLWVREAITCAISEFRSFDLEYRILHSDGTTRWVWERGTGVADEHGRPVAIEGLVQDVTKRKNAEHALREAERRYHGLFDNAIEGIFRTTVEGHYVDANPALAHIYGYESPDELMASLRDIGNELYVEKQRRDEFMNIMRARGSVTGFESRIYRKSGDIIWISENARAVLDDGEEALTLLKHADSAMYRAKDNGRNNFQFFTRELNALMIEQLELETHLRRALERNQFVLRYQPRVHLATGQIVGAEALLRWRIPQRGTVAPMRFISLAEETGLIVPIGKWVLQTACAQNKAWQDAGFPPIVVSVNVSPRQFRHENLVQAVAEVLRSTGLEPRFLELELTESMVMHDAPKLVAMLDELKELGVKVAVDDFGTGYSSLSYLKRFPVDRLKVDRSFVENMTTEADDATIVRTIIALGHNLGLKVVAEGVETAQQARALRAYQCDEAQGFLFARAVSARVLPRLITRSIPGQRV